jgi:hypothetical protein
LMSCMRLQPSRADASHATYARHSRTKHALITYASPDETRRVQGTSAPIFEDADARACSLLAVSRTPPLQRPLVECGQFDWPRIICGSSVGLAAVSQCSMVGSCPRVLCMAMARALHATRGHMSGALAGCSPIACCSPCAASRARLPPPLSILLPVAICGCYMPLSVPDSRPMPGCSLPGAHGSHAACRMPLLKPGSPFP